MRSFARSLKAVLLLPMLWLGFSTSASSQCSTCGPTDQEYTFYLKTTGGNSGINTKLSGGGKQCGVGDKIVISMNQNGVYDLEVKTDFPEPYMDEHENTVSCFFDNYIVEGLCGLESRILTEDGWSPWENGCWMTIGLMAHWDGGVLVMTPDQTVLEAHIQVRPKQQAKDGRGSSSPAGDSANAGGQSGSSSRAKSPAFFMATGGGWAQDNSVICFGQHSARIHPIGDAIHFGWRAALPSRDGIVGNHDGGVHHLVAFQHIVGAPGSCPLVDVKSCRGCCA